VIHQIKTSRFALQVHETIDVVKCEYFITYVRYVMENDMWKECFVQPPHWKYSIRLAIF